MGRKTLTKSNARLSNGNGSALVSGATGETLTVKVEANSPKATAEILVPKGANSSQQPRMKAITKVKIRASEGATIP